MATLLIVDDGGQDRSGLRRSLEDAGHRVVDATGEGALDRAAEELSRLGAELQSAIESARRAEGTDPLTGLANRRSLQETGAQELARVQRSSGLLCVLVADVDRLEEINEKHGHAAGDQVVAAVARVLSSTVRAVDFAARLDGGCFAIVAPMTDCKGAVELAERMRDRVASTPVRCEEAELQPTLSVGVAQGTPKTSSFDALLTAAEQSLRRAKGAGRNRVAATIYVAPEEAKPVA